MAYVVLIILITVNNTVAASPLQYVYIILFAILIKHLNRTCLHPYCSSRFALHTLLHFLMGLFFNNKLHNYIFSMSYFSRVLFSNPPNVF
ncbi:hypothetical protein ACJX0J_033662, partial [Zea mays]